MTVLPVVTGFLYRLRTQTIIRQKVSYVLLMKCGEQVDQWRPKQQIKHRLYDRDDVDHCNGDKDDDDDDNDDDDDDDGDDDDDDDDDDDYDDDDYDDDDGDDVEDNVDNHDDNGPTWPPGNSLQVKYDRTQSGCPKTKKIGRQFEFVTVC